MWWRLLNLILGLWWKGTIEICVVVKSFQIIVETSPLCNMAVGVTCETVKFKGNS